MARAHLADFDAEVAYRIAFANATLRAVEVGLGSPAHQRLLELVAAERISPDLAVQMVAHGYGVRIDHQMTLRISRFDDYLIPGTLMLRSRIVDDRHPDGIENLDQFRSVELDITRIRAVDLAITPEPGHLDYTHFKAIHARLFADIYPWAGEERVGPESSMVRFARNAVDFERGDSAAPMITYRYPPGPEIAEAMSVQFAQLHNLLRRRDLTRNEVLGLLSEFAGEIFAIHAFRDGNLRAQWVFGLQYDEELGYPIDPFEMLRNSHILDDMAHHGHRYVATGDFEGIADIAEKMLANPSPNTPVRDRQPQ